MLVDFHAVWLNIRLVAVHRTTRVGAVAPHRKVRFLPIHPFHRLNDVHRRADAHLDMTDEEFRFILAAVHRPEPHLVKLEVLVARLHRYTVLAGHHQILKLRVNGS